MIRKPRGKEIIYLILIIIFYVSGLTYVYYHNFSFLSLYKYGLIQEKGIEGEKARLEEIDTPLSWNIPQVLYFIYIKACGVLIELFQYWIIGMFIAAALIVFVPWEKVKMKMGYGGWKSNIIAASAGAVIPICSCGIVPVLAGMIEAGIPLGPTMAFLIAAPMLNIPAVFMTAGVLNWKLAIGRILGTFFIALSVGQIMTKIQKKQRFLKRLIKINASPALSKELTQFAFEVSKKLINYPKGLLTEELAPGQEDKLYLLGEAGIIDRNREGRWFLPISNNFSIDASAACFVLPYNTKPGARVKKLVETAWDFFLQLNYYLILAVLMAGAIKVIIPSKIILEFVGGKSLNSVFISSLIALLAYVCTYVEVPTALALMHKGMGGGAILAYLLGGPGLSLPSIIMLSGVFRAKILWLYVIMSFIGCILFGYLYNLF